MNFALLSCLVMLLVTQFSLGDVIECPSFNICYLKNVSKATILTNMTKVTSLSIVDTNFDEQSFILEHFQQLKSLKIHNSSFLDVDSFVQSIIKSHIKILDLSHNKGIKAISKQTFRKKITDDEFDDKETTEYLFVLNLAENGIEEVSKGAFTAFDSLEELDLSHNLLKDLKGPLTDRVLFNLKTLKLDNNLLENISDDVFKGIYSLERLDLNDNSLKMLPSGVLKPLKNLRQLDVSHNALESLEILSPKLKMLNVEHNDLEIDRIRGLDRLTYLKTLKISFNPIGNVNNETFMRLISLEELKMEALTDLQFTTDDIFPATLANLKYLSLRNNKLSDIQNLSLQKLPKLILLQLDQNRLPFINSSDLPSSLRYIGLQGNLFKCNFLQEFLTHIRDNNVRLFFQNESRVLAGQNVVQGIECFANRRRKFCQDDYIDFYTWHTKLSSLVCLALAVTYIGILWRNKEAIRKIKDEEYEHEELLLQQEEKEFYDNSESFNFDDLLAKEKSNEILY